MALITCPECGKEISDMAPACIHCGYPLGNIKVNHTIGKNTICLIKGQKYDLSKTLKTIQDHPEFCYPTAELLGSTNPIIEQIAEDIKPLDHRDRYPLIRIIEKDGEVPNIYMPKYPLKTEIENNNPKCPHCKSTEIKKLDGVDRAVSIGLFGLSSNKINKSFQCKKCKYTW